MSKGKGTLRRKLNYRGTIENKKRERNRKEVITMKYYSDVTKALYDSAEACTKAEELAKEKANKEKLQKEQEAYERKVAADKVTDARRAYNEAYKAYRATLNEFCKKYGAYHTTITNKEGKENTSVNDVLDFLFDWM